MNRPNLRRGFTLVELVVVILVLGFLIVLVLPVVEHSRGAARRAACINKMKQLGLGVHNFHDKFKRFPPSCHVERDPVTGKITAVDGWSWFVDALPELECNPLWQTMDYPDGKPLVEPVATPNGSTPHADALATDIYELRCPSYSGSPFADPGKTAAITNYKVMGATHIESLNVASTNPTTPKYAPKKQHPDGTAYHPDGACFPGSKLAISDFKIDGTAHTILIVESAEPKFARWTVGAEATLVGLPPSVEYQKVTGPYGSHDAPIGHTPGKFDDQSTIDPSFHTYLDWDYQSHPYDRADGSRGGTFGPSSHHPGIVNHTFVDGSVHSIWTEIDVALYMFLITRNGSDPTGAYQD